MRKKTTYEQDLERDLKDPRFREMYERERAAALIAVEIREARRRRNWTQTELARRVGTSQSAIARLESGTYGRYTVDVLRRIARATGSRLEVRLKPEGRRRFASA